MLTVLLRLRRTNDPILKPQLKWLALAAVGGFLPFVLFSALPVLLAIPAVPVSFTLLFAVVTPICISFAVFRYRLLDVDRIFDWVLVHAVVLGGLSFFEIAFWSWMDRHYAKDSASVPLLIAFSMFFIVSIYAPLRSGLFRFLARLSGRSRPSAIDSIRKLLECAYAEGDPQRALEQTLCWTLKPDQISWLDPTQMQDALLERMENVQDGLLGFELGDVCPEKMQSTAWVPIQTAQGPAAVVLWPQGGRGWTRQDLRLARTLGHFGEPLLKIQSMQHEHSKATNAMRQQRDELLREMHDGLGGQLFGASLLTQVSEDASPEEMRRRLREANAALAEALDSLRTGLTILSSPPGAFGPALIALLLRAERVLSAAGIHLETEVSDEVASLQMEGNALFSVLRAIQEGFTNIAQHSKGKNASVHISLQDRTLLVRIEDDGVGFNVDQVSGGFGLDDIRMRMQIADGRSTITSTPQQGCTLMLELQLKTGIDERQRSECFAN
jgi:signal transduction histidine kinase